MSSSLGERIGRLGPTRAVGRVPCGSPAVLALSPGPDRSGLKTVAAALALARRGVPLLRAKRALEEMIARGRAYLQVPTVEDEAALARELSEAGVVGTPAAPPETDDVRAVRGRLGLTQEQFALRYGLDPDAVRNWEHGRRRPDTAARSYLRVIERDPRGVEEALQGTPAAPPSRVAREADEGSGEFLLALSGQGGPDYMAEIDRRPVDRPDKAGA